MVCGDQMQCSTTLMLTYIFLPHRSIALFRPGVQTLCQMVSEHTQLTSLTLQCLGLAQAQVLYPGRKSHVSTKTPGISQEF